MAVGVEAELMVDEVLEMMLDELLELAVLASEEKALLVEALKVVELVVGAAVADFGVPCTPAQHQLLASPLPLPPQS